MLNLILYVCLCIGVCCLNKITNKHPVWTGIIPFYNNYIVFEYAESKHVFFIVMLITTINLFVNSSYALISLILYILQVIISYNAYKKLCYNFFQSGVMVWVILLLGGIGILILGLTAHQYRPNYEENPSPVSVHSTSNELLTSNVDETIINNDQSESEQQ